MLYTRRIFTPLFAIALLIVQSAVAQEADIAATGDEIRADRLFFDENYKAALEEYMMVLKKKPEDTKINYNIGLCYLNSDFEKVNALPYFEKVIFYDEEASTVYFLMGKVYQSQHKFDRAIEMFNRFIETYKMGSEYSVEEAQEEIEYCENAYQLIKFPKGCLYENLGPKVNSPYMDNFPFVTIDEGLLVFTSKRDDGSKKLPDGTFASNVYYAKVVDGEYEQAIVMEGANDPAESEVVCGMSPDGERMLLMRGAVNVSGDIFEGTYNMDGRLENIGPLSEQVNSKKSSEIAATYGEDQNTIFFVSDREGGFGGTDIWVVKRLPNGKWGVPFNAGRGVNTPRDEDFPNLAPDGQHLYFSSKGHFSMGGYDIFKARWDADSNAFINPRNLGYPVNSVGDDMNYRESRSGRYGYISALRPDGYGDYDIYRLTITEIESEYTVLRGSIKAEKGQISGSTITASNLKTGELFTYTPNQSTQRYVMALDPGEFDVLIEAEGMQPVAFEVKVLGKSSYQPEIVKDVVMKPE